MFNSVWKTFRAKFSPVVNSLKRHRELLEKVKSTATYGELQKIGNAVQQSIDKGNEELKHILNGIQQQKKQILEKLGSDQASRNEKGHRRMPEQRFPASGDWILQDPLFTRWFDVKELSNNILYLNGMPGAGK